MNCVLPHNVVGSNGLDRRLNEGAGRPAGSFARLHDSRGVTLLVRSPVSIADLRWGSIATPLDAPDDTLLWRLLTDDALKSDDAFRRYLAELEQAPDLRLDASMEAAIARLHRRLGASGLVVPDLASGPILLPPPVRDQRPIVVRGATLEAAPRLLSEATITSLFEDAIADDQPEPLAIDTSTTIASPIDLSTALDACLADDRVQFARVPRRRRSFARPVLWAAAAALAAIAVVPGVHAWRAPTVPAMGMAVATPMVEKPATPARASAPAPQIEPVRAAKIDAAPAPAPRLAAKAPALPTQPVSTPEVKMATVEPVAVSSIKADAIRTPAEVAAPDLHPAREVAATAAVLPTPMVSAAPAMARPAASASPARTTVARTARRKPRKTTIGKETAVASALTLPDVLKPH